MEENQLSTYRIQDMSLRIKIPPLDIMLVGVTGAGKSSTINALLGSDAAKIGWGAAPETKEIRPFKLNDYIRFWDTPGLGDSPDEDAAHLEKISSYLNRANMKNGAQCGKLVDAVLVIIDGSRRDLGAIYQLLNGTIFRNIDSRNVLFAVNQADMAMSGRHWNENTSSPDDTLADFLREQALSVQKRISENTGRTVSLPLCYSATAGFNTTTLIDYILDKLPPQRKTGETQKQYTVSSSSYDSSDDIGERIGEIVAAPIVAVANFFEWLTLL